MMVLTYPLYAGWSEPMRLTYRGYEINPQLTAINDTLHLTWFQLADSQNVSYIQSNASGQNWGDVINLNTPGHHGLDVNLTKIAGQLFVGWFDYIPNGPISIAYSISDYGNIWDIPAYIQGISTQIGGPVATTISGDSIYGVYYAYSRDSTGNTPFKICYSSDLGQTWSNEQTVAYAPSYYCNSLIIKKCGGVLYIVWTAIPSPENTTWECQVIISRNGGQSWEPKIILSQNGGSPAQRACASCNPVDGSFAVGWMDQGYPGSFYMRITNDSGYTWGQEIQNVTSHNISDPAIDFIGDTIWATWTDWNFADNWQIGYSKSTNLGQTWTEPERISNTTGTSMTPWLSYDNGKVHLVWQEDGPASQDRDIYYRRYDPDNDIDEYQEPTSYGLLKSYPNPFNSTTKITFSDNKGGEIEIYDISGGLIKSLLVKDKSEGSVFWDARDGLGQPLASGIYIAKSKTTRGVCTAKLVHLK
jgi:hypothetical protein